MLSQVKTIALIAGTTTLTFGLASVAQAASIGLNNPSFETPDLGNAPTFSQLNPNATGWQTTDSSVEIWANGFNGVTAADGTQFAEINAVINGTIFQEVSGIDAGADLQFYFSHRARVGTDVMKLTITDLGLDGVFGGEDDTNLFQKNYSATTAAWNYNSSAGEDPIRALGNNIRFSYSAVSTGSGSPSVGNFLDNANFGVNIMDVEPEAVPEPITGLVVAAGVGGAALRRAKSKKS